DFVKLDAEGAELNILAGGQRFFEQQSPLVMFERQHSAVENSGLPAAFVERGYDLYRLIGPDTVLVPFDQAAPADPYLLNMFACKPDRAATLAAAGLLTGPAAQATPRAGCGLELWRQQRFAADLAHLPLPADARYGEALDKYAAWRE